MWALLLNKYVIGAGIGLAMLIGAYGYGYFSASSRCRDAALLAEIQTLKADAAIAEQANREADAARIAAEKLAEQLQGKNDEYEAELAKRPSPACARTPAERDGLRRLLEKAR